MMVLVSSDVLLRNRMQQGMWAEHNRPFVQDSLRFRCHVDLLCHRLVICHQLVNSKEVAAWTCTCQLHSRHLALGLHRKSSCHRLMKKISSQIVSGFVKNLGNGIREIKCHVKLCHHLSSYMVDGVASNPTSTIPRTLSPPNPIHLMLLMQTMIKCWGSTTALELGPYETRASKFRVIIPYMPQYPPMVVLMTCSSH